MNRSKAKKEGKSPFAERLESEMETWHVNQALIASRLGISPGTVSGWFAKGALPQPRIRADLAAIFDVTPEWLIYGREPRLSEAARRRGEAQASTLAIPPDKRPISENAALYGVTPRMIPVLSWAQAGVAADFDEMPVEWQTTIPSTCQDKNAVAIILRGDSMEPKHYDGDIAVVMPMTFARHSDLVIAKIKEEGLVFKIFNLVGGDPNRIRLSSYNPAYSPNEYTRDQFHFIMPVHSVTKLTRR